MTLYELVDAFLIQSKTENLFTKQYPSTYESFSIKISFGKGNVAKVPWIAFLKGFNTVRRGVYPIVLLYKAQKCLIIAFGISESFLPDTFWKFTENYKSINEFFRENNYSEPKYGESKIYKIYSLENLSLENVIRDIDNILDKYTLV